ncbi:MAG TPA: helix-turn-helix domain-containing protein [Thermoanaerobaculia bacterium]|nr:helix-turn-helix domain-containing protein [Thermoanaerobaculia bacterium]
MRHPEAIRARIEVATLDVREIRYRLGQSQSDFADMIGVSLPTLQSWEEGKRLPDGPALALLRVAAKNPRIVAKALGH